MERAGVMGGAETDRETTEPVAGLARFSGHILGTRLFTDLEKWST
jgi:hypothetical protein